MSALGHKRTSRHVRTMSALPPKADIAGCDRHVRPVPQAGHQFLDCCLALRGVTVKRSRSFSFVLAGSVFEKIDIVFVGGEFRPAKETNR